MKIAGTALAALALTALAACPVVADEVADFYKGRTVTVVVPVSPGGTFHLYAQIVQQHIRKHIPGNPTTVLQTRPGAGGATANAYMMHAAAKDGTVLAEINPGTMTLPLLRPSKYDPRKFE